MRQCQLGREQDLPLLIVRVASQSPIFTHHSGTETEYQDLAFSGRPIWEEWNKQIRGTPAHLLPKGLTPSDEVFVPCGFLRMGNGPELSAYDKECLVELEKAGLRHHQHVLVRRLILLEQLFG